MEANPRSAGRRTDTWPGLVDRPPRESGQWPAGITAVLVHGAMDRGAGMAHLARRLRDAPTLRYDRRGYGRARKLGAGNLVDHIDDLIGLVDTRPVVLFGHSFGGLVVLGAAATGRVDVRGVATWEVPTPWIPDWGAWGVDRRVTDPADIAERFMRATIGDELWNSLGDSTRNARRAEGRALAADMDAALTRGVPFNPRRIRSRCVFGVGGETRAPYLRGARWLRDHVEDAEIRVLDGAGHGAPMSHPDDVTRLIRQAVAENEDHPRETDEQAV